MKAHQKSIEELLSDGSEIDRAMRDAVCQALRRHKRLGESVVVWENGRVVELPPDEIEATPGPTADADARPTEAA